jgi:hypothetical protein
MSADPPSPRPDHAAYQLRVLTELVEIGMAIARTLPAQAAVEAAAHQAHCEAGQAAAAADYPPNLVPPPPASNAALAFSRIQRAIRQAFELMNTVSDRTAERDKTRQFARNQRRNEVEKDPIHHHKDRVRRRVEQAILAHAAPAEADFLLEDLDLHLDDEAIAEALGHHPDDTIVARICHNIGLAAAAAQHPFPFLATPQAHAPPC